MPARNPRVTLAAAALLAIFASQVMSSMAVKSATYDEQVYIAAGYIYLDRGDFRLKRDAPPLLSTLAGASLHLGRLFGVQINTPIPGKRWEQCLNWGQGAEWKFSREMFELKGNDGFLMLQLGRLPILGFGLLLGWLVFAFARRLFGDAGGLLALALFCLDPNMIGHSRVVSADIPVSAMMVATLLCFHRLLGEARWRALPWFALSLAGCLLVKYTGMLVLPALAVVGLVHLAWPDPQGPGGAEQGPARLWLVRRGAAALGAGLAAAVVLSVPLYQRLDAPLAYVQGLEYVYQTRHPGYLFYLLGEFHPESLAHYYLYASVFKAPASAIALLALALLPWGRPMRWRARLFLLAPVIVLMVVASQDQVNHCQRRVLAIYPFLFILVGRLAWAWRVGRGHRRWQAAALVALLLGSAWSAWRIHPHQLSFFNLLVGGAQNGHRYLDDANIDWGQDLPGLKAYMVQAGVGEVAYLGSAVERPESYGIKTRQLKWNELRQPRRAVYALGVHYQIRLKDDERVKKDARMDWLERFEPTEKAGYSINIYDFRGGVPAGAGTKNKEQKILNKK